MLIQKNKMAGMSIVEVLLAVAMLLFVSYVGLKILSSSSKKVAVLSKKVALTDKLDDRVSKYTLLNTFDNTDTDNIIFSATNTMVTPTPDNSYTIYSFKATDDSNIEIKQQIFARAS